MDPNVVNLIAVLGSATTTIGVVIALYVRLDTKIDNVKSDLDTKIDSVKSDLEAKLDTKVDRVHEQLDTKIDGIHAKLDTKIDGVARDVVEVKVAVARIEGYLEAGGSFTRARPASPRGETTDAPTEYRRTG